MAIWNTEPTPTQAKAFLGTSEVSAIFSFNPDEVKWSYKNNTVSRDTIGGRVVQILSSSVEAMTVIGRTGNRNNLQVFANDLKRVMQYHIKTGNPVQFKVPSRNWNFLVYVQNISGLGWDVTTTSYPYQITLMIEDDLSNVINYKFKEDAFKNLVEGIGYNKKFHGGDLSAALTYAEATLNSINSVDLSRTGSNNEQTQDDSSNNKRGGYSPKGGGGTGNAAKAKALTDQVDMSTRPDISSGRFLTGKDVYALAYWALEQSGNLSGTALRDAAIMATAISFCESGTHDTEARNGNATNGTAFGIWQMGEGLGTSLWDPYVAALWMAKEYYQQQWLYWGCGPTNPNGNHGYTKYMDEARSLAS